jgi:hypothetical protein
MTEMMSDDVIDARAPGRIFAMHKNSPKRLSGAVLPHLDPLGLVQHAK